MKILLNKILPAELVETITGIKQFYAWKRRGYLENVPQFVKENIFLKFGIPNAQWVETGTYIGTTTSFLVKHFASVYTIEPGKDLYNNAVKKFANQNVKLFNDVSESVIPKLLPTLKGDVNFWLDGHYSAGITFKGGKDCPIEDELKAIKENLANFNKVAILVDDVRCFLLTGAKYADYPSIDYLVDWARDNGFNWRIEHDIFVMRNFS